MLLTSNPASNVDVATYFATEPKPGEQSVIGRSLSTVLGMPMQVKGSLSSLAIFETLKLYLDYLRRRYKKYSMLWALKTSNN